MTNELMSADQNITFEAKYTPAIIQISDYEKLKNIVSDYAAKYTGLTFTAEDVKGAKSVRAELRKAETVINDRRIEIKKEINKPLDEFERKIKDLTKIIKDTIAPIDNGIKEIEAAEKVEKQNKINEIIEDLANNQNINSSRIAIDPKWMNKSTNEVTIRGAVAQQIESLLEIDEQKAKDTAFIKEYAEKRDLESAGWLTAYKNGSNLTEIINKIDKAIEQQKAKLAEELERQKAAEATARAKEEAQKRAELVQSEGVQPTIDEVSAVSLMTEPPVYEQENVSEPIEAGLPTRTAIIEIEGTNDQLKALNSYMVSNNIKVKKHTCDGDQK
ncbi:DUF1351 domain-containing protein [Listeria booriae]|uniref:DUF1351 domain-containing protein n=1 Tax=Listeria booriae TaxID=1552123 RepID=A0A7X1CY54_9LIST|nr:DUF1351 domain-containing protein [Listeria booriae]MBC2115720.1 DUF1351 domain-containing protein [Listeria booriae]